MKAVYLSLFFLCITVALGLMDATGLLDVKLAYQEESIDDFQDWYGNLQPYSKPLSEEKEYVSEDSESSDRGVGFFDTVIRCLVPTVLLIDTFGIDRTVALIVTTPIYLIYAVALAQIFRLISGGKSAI